MQESNNSNVGLNIDDENVLMSELMGPELKVETGKVFSAVVVGQNEDGVLVDLGLKYEALIPKTEFEDGVAPKELELGKNISVKFVRFGNNGGSPIVSFRELKEAAIWETLSNAQHAAASIEGTIKKKVKGGFVVDIGLDAFLPSSQLDLRVPKNPKDLDNVIGKKYEFAITEINRAQRNVVLSRRVLLEKSVNEQKSKLFAEVEEGQIRDGVVRNITKFGAFVDIGGIDGLLYIGDLAWYRVKNVEDILKVGQRVRVSILKINKKEEKISLGLKQLSVKPWDGAAERYPSGLIIKGKVSSVSDFGVFVELEQGVEGLIHISETSWLSEPKNLKQMFSVGSEVEAKVLAIDETTQKISLSIKQMTENPWENAYRHYAPGARVKGVVSGITPFGVFVKLPEGGVQGLVHVGELSWTKKIKHPNEVVKQGSEIEVVVLSVDPKNEKISLSVKKLTQDPVKKYKVGAVVKGTVARLNGFGAFVTLEEGIDALLRNGEIDATKKIEDPSTVLAVGQEVEAKVIKNEIKERKIEISIKKLDRERERELIKQFANKDEKPTLGELLVADDENEDESTVE
ncbi:MAG: 30S ribosomal protein S1 [Endomicrobiales bacterium]|nr:30S ribosomal protein S1 [Endomicrobiales bacterium]